MNHAITPTASRGLQQAGRAPENTEQMRAALERRGVLVDLALWMADGTARADIETECRLVRSNDADWYDLDTAGTEREGIDEPAYTRSIVARADRYFALRDNQADQFRVIRHPAFPHLLRFEPIERTCRNCGCTDSQACAGGCWWIEADLCSSCQGAQA